MDNKLKWFEIIKCNLCNGSGKCHIQEKDTFTEEEEDCPICDGKGELKIWIK